MDDKTKALVERLPRLERIVQQATPGPWCVESLGEKGDGTHVIGVAFGPDDQNAERPLSGWLEPFDKDGDEIDYCRDEEVAACEHRNRNSGPNAIYIMTFDPPTVLAMIAAIRAQAEQLAAAEAKLAALLSAEGCDVEGAARVLCKSGKFETGQGTCALTCMDQLGDARKRPCSHVVEVHGDLVSAALAVGCAPLRAKIEKMEAVVKAACEYEAYPSERALDELETRVIEYTRREQEKE